MKLSECIADYLNHIRHERNLAKSTCLHYQCWLRHFTDWLDALCMLLIDLIDH